VKLYLIAYVAVALPTLLAMCFVVAPFGVEDEPAHFLRADQISNGGFLPVAISARREAGGFVDRQAGSLAAGFHEAQAGVYAPSEAKPPYDRVLVFRAFNNTAIYFPGSYICPAASIYVARLFGFGSSGWFYAARISNALMAVAVTTLAIALLESGTAAALVLSLSPMALTEEASIAPDAIIIPLSFLFCALLLKISKGAVRKIPFFYTQLCITLLILCVGKIAYIPLAILPPLIVLFRQDFVKRDFLQASAVTLIVLTVWTTWSLSIRGRTFPISGGHIDVEQQAHMILHNPLLVVRMIFYTATDAKNVRFLLRSFFGGFLGWQTVKTPWLILAVAAFNLLLASITRKESTLPRLSSLSIVGASLASFVLVFLAIYLQNSPVGSRTAIGVQGRYFIPLYLPVLLAIPRLKKLPSLAFERALPAYLVVSSAISCAGFLLFLCGQNWVGG
jgi:uncharacterized membrane protein